MSYDGGIWFKAREGKEMEIKVIAPMGSTRTNDATIEYDPERAAYARSECWDGESGEPDVFVVIFEPPQPPKRRWWPW